jgi:hypothetical protein
MKIVIGVATLLVTLLPFVIMAMVFLPMISMSMMDWTQIDQTGEFPFPFSFFSSFFLIVPLMMCISFLQLGLMAFYIVHIVKNRTGSEVIRILAGVGMYMLPWLAMPAYFLIYVWPEEIADWALEKAS